MNKQRERENFAYFDEHRPEPKMELVEGRLLVGNGLAGSRLLLDHILRGYEADAAVALGSIEQWIEAFCAAYQLAPPARVDDAALTSLAETASRLSYIAPDFTDGEEGEEAGHWLVRSHLAYSFWEVAGDLGGNVFGRDVVMRLGENGFTPDLFFFKNRKLNKLYHYYLKGPAELVFEVTRPAHRHYDARVKREHYARAGVPEYVIVDPASKEIEFLRLVSGDYVRQTPDADGLYRPRSAPGLAIDPRHFWPEEEGFSIRGERNPFIVEQKQPGHKRERGIRDGLGWGEASFEPRLDLYPVKLRFEEFICWSPESKFEFWDGRIQICGDEGIRNIVGMLLMTLGLVEVCGFAPPVEIIAALKRKREFEVHEQEIRAEWRRKAVRAANDLRSQFGLKRIAITGDLLSSKPLNYWSRLTLAVWDVPSQDEMRVYEQLKKDDIDFIEADRKYFQERIRKRDYLLEEI
ncbi:MAG: Uma2 family endonuclease [Blastocatellia bacterium]